MAKTNDRPIVSSYLPLRPVEFQIMLVLADGESHGYGIMQSAERRTDGRMILEPGTLYRALRRLTGSGLIEESARRPVAQLDDERRRYYKLTTLGRRVAAAEAERMERLVAAARQSALIKGTGRA